MTKSERLIALTKLMPEGIEEATAIRFCTDGRLLVWHGEGVTQVPEWKLIQIMKVQK